MLLPSVRRKLPRGISEEGRWWGSDPIARREVEIDYVGFGSNVTVLGVAKWRNELLSESVYNDLVEKGRLLHGEKIYYLFSKSGFTDPLINRAAVDNKIHLVTFQQMLEAFSYK